VQRARQHVPPCPMPADLTPSVLITDPHCELGQYVALRFAREGWFVMGCGRDRDVARFTKVQLVTDLEHPEDCLRTLAQAAQRANGLDVVVDLRDASLLGDAAVPVVQAVSGTVVRIPEAPGTTDELIARAELAWLQAKPLGWQRVDHHSH
jgi:NAD(P)-dependent dehydrogenase (short-subunit alcohol dehydrogenase family)